MPLNRSTKFDTKHDAIWACGGNQGYFKAIVSTLCCVCKTCSRILLPEEERRSALAFMKKVLAS